MPVSAQQCSLLSPTGCGESLGLGPHPFQEEVWPGQWQNGLGPFGMVEKLLLFFFSCLISMCTFWVFSGASLKNLRTEIVRTIGKKTKAPQTSLVCTSFNPIKQPVFYQITLPHFYLSRISPNSNLTNGKVHFVGGWNTRGLSPPFMRVVKNSTDVYVLGFQTLTNLKELYS